MGASTSFGCELSLFDLAEITGLFSEAVPEDFELPFSLVSATMVEWATLVLV